MNSGTLSDDITVKGPGSSPGFAASYFDGNTNVTNQVTGGGYAISGLSAGQGKNLKLKVVTSGAATGSKQFKIESRSAGDSNARDTVKAKVIIK